MQTCFKERRMWGNVKSCFRERDIWGSVSPLATKERIGIWGDEIPSSNLTRNKYIRQFVLTGPAYAGKSTLIEKLDENGYTIVPEAETAIVQRLKDKYGPDATGKWILENYPRFKSMVGRRQARLEKNIIADFSEPVIFDRSAIDWIAYCKLRDSEVPQILQDLADQYRFEGVFLCEMLDDFDERRKEGRVMTKDEAQRLQELIVGEYTQRGYKITRVPAMSLDEIDQRVKVVTDYLPKNSS